MSRPCHAAAIEPLALMVARRSDTASAAQRTSRYSFAAVFASRRPRVSINNHTEQSQLHPAIDAIAA